MSASGSYDHGPTNGITELTEELLTSATVVLVTTSTNGPYSVYREIRHWSIRVTRTLRVNCRAVLKFLSRLVSGVYRKYFRESCYGQN
jgi:hypothetical protein